jgi:hypothetical protein
MSATPTPPTCARCGREGEDVRTCTVSVKGLAWWARDERRGWYCEACRAWLRENGYDVREGEQ